MYKIFKNLIKIRVFYFYISKDLTKFDKNFNSQPKEKIYFKFIVNMERWPE